MAESESKFRLEAWILTEQNLNKIWDELGRVTNQGSGYIECKYKDRGENSYSNPLELVSRETNSSRNAVINVRLSRSSSKRSARVSVSFMQSGLFQPFSIYISVTKEHEDSKADLTKIENVLLNTRPWWWWIEPIKLILALLTWFIVIIVILIFPNFLVKENWILSEASVWEFAIFFISIAIIFAYFLCRWLLPSATLAIGEGMRREANLITVRKIISLGGGVVAFLLIILLNLIDAA